MEKQKILLINTDAVFLAHWGEERAHKLQKLLKERLGENFSSYLVRDRLPPSIEYPVSNIKRLLDMAGKGKVAQTVSIPKLAEICEHFNIDLGDLLPVSTIEITKIS